MTGLKDVAKYTGLSTSTVSRVLANKESIKEETKRRVLEAVQVLGYSPNTMAQGLKMGRSNTVALLIPSIQNLICADVVRGVEDTARKKGFTVILCNTDEDPAGEEAYIRTLRPRLIDGFIVTSVTPQSTHILALRQEGFPVVLALRAFSDEIDAVLVDNVKAAYDATSFLVNRGHRRIALALGNTDLPLYEDRFRGYKAALEKGGIPFDEALVLREQENIRSFYHLTRQLLLQGPAPDAVFATTDARAIIVMRALYDAGLRVPEDVSVIGFDNVEISGLVQPPLTTISQPLYEIGVRAAEKLIYQIRHKEKYGALEPPVVDIMETKLLIRKSVR